MSEENESDCDERIYIRSILVLLSVRKSNGIVIKKHEMIRALAKHEGKTVEERYNKAKQGVKKGLMKEYGDSIKFFRVGLVQFMSALGGCAKDELEGWKLWSAGRAKQDYYIKKVLDHVLTCASKETRDELEKHLLAIAKEI